MIDRTGPEVAKPAKRPRSLSLGGFLVAAAVVAFIGLLVGVAISLYSGTNEPTEAALVTDTEEAGEVEQADASVPVAEPVVQSDIVSLLGQGREALNKESWGVAIAAAHKALELDGNNETAKQLLATAEHEHKNEERFDAFQGAVAAKSYSEIAHSFNELEDDSVYKDRARDNYDRARNAYGKAKEAEAKKLLASRSRKKCESISNLHKAATDLWGSDFERLADYESRCPVKRGSRPPRLPDSPRKPKSEKSYDELIQDLEAQVRRGLYGAALRSCTQAYAKKSTQSLAVKCGFMACKAKNSSNARKFYSRLSKVHYKNQVKQICLPNGIDPSK